MRRLQLSLILSLLFTPYFASAVPTVQVGAGYSTDENQVAMSNCINVGTVTYSGSTQSGDFMANYSLDAVQQQLGINITTTANPHIGSNLFLLDERYNFVKTASSQNLTETFIYRTNYLFKDSDYNLPTTEPILNAIGQQYQNDPVDFRQYCGDSYITQIHNGAYLYTVLQFQFLTPADQQTFDINIADHANNVSTFIQTLNKMSSYAIQGTMHVAGVQAGGDPSQLATILDSNTVNCSLTNPAACVQSMQTLISYNNGNMGSNSFPAQLVDPTHGAIPPENAVAVGYELENDQIIVPVKSAPSQLTPIIVAARDQLGRDTESYMTLLNQANYLITVPFNYHYVYDAYKQNLSTASNKINNNLIILNNAGQTCFANLSQCLSVEHQAYQQIQPVTAKDMALPGVINLIETNDSAQTPQIFVDAGTSSARGEHYYGTIAQPTSTAEYDVYELMNGSRMSIMKYDHNTQQLLATYDGVDQGNNQFSGTVEYPTTQASGTWTATIVPSPDTPEQTK